MKFTPFLKKAAIGLTMATMAATSFAADYPDRPINMIVGYKAGGGTDTYARSLAKAAGDFTNGQPIVVVNKPGGGGLIGGRFVADQPANGYTIYLASSGSMVLRNLVKAQVVSSNDFRAIATIGDLTAGVFVPAASPIQDLAQLIDAVKAADSPMRWGHTGRNNVWHVAGVGLLSKNNAKAVDVPFKGGAGVRSAVIAAQVDFGVMGVHLGRGFEGDMRLLGTLAEVRHAAAPNAPTAGEQGVAFTQVTTPIMVMAPKRTSDEVANKLTEMVLNIVNTDEYKSILDKAGLPTKNLNAAESQALLDFGKENWKSLMGN